MRSFAPAIVLCVCALVAPARAADDDAVRPDGLPRTWTTPRAVAPSAVPTGEPRRIMRNPPWAYRIDRAGFRPRGPSDVRDEWILAQPHLTLPAVSPDPVPVGAWRARLYVNRGSDFGWSQVGPGETPTDRRFLVDGEHQTTQIGARYGLLPKLSLGVRVPVHWRGGGFMDAIIDGWHSFFEPLGLRDNGRPSFLADAYRVEGRTPGFAPVSWTDERGWGLGNVEIETHWNFVKPWCRSDWRAAAVARIGLPTGTGPYDGTGFEAGFQVAAAKQLGRRWDVYAGAGGTVFTDTLLDGVRYETWRAHGFLAVEYHLSRRVSIVVGTDAASRLVTNLQDLPGTHWYIHAVTRWDVSDTVEAEIGFTENLANRQATVDFGAFVGFTFRL